MKTPKSGTRELPKEGSHNSVCVIIADLGTQPSNNPEWGDKRQVVMVHELPDVATKDGKPVTISGTYTFGDSPKGNLAKIHKSWLGVKNMGDYEIDSSLGKPGLLNVVHNKNERGTFANIDTIIANKGKVRRPQTDLTSFYMEPGKKFDKGSFDALPEWIREKIAISPEYEQLTAGGKKSPAKKGKK